MTQFQLLHGDCLEKLKELPDCSVDSVVTDPPYGLNFMGKAWDSFGREIPAGIAISNGSINPMAGATGKAHSHGLAGHDPVAFQSWCAKWAAECLRVLKPGGHLLAFGGTRTYHRMACAIEDAGFEVRDSIHWVYGSGFPKSLDVSKAIDAKLLTGGSAPKNLRERAMGSDYEPHKLAGSEGYGTSCGGGFGADESRDRSADLPITTDAARQWEGWGTALKPAHEPIVVARKPLGGTVAANVLAHGTGAINIDGCRVPAVGRPLIESRADDSVGVFGNGLNGSRLAGSADLGRWPPNVLFAHLEACEPGACAEGCAVAELDRQSGFSKTPATVTRGASRSGHSGLARLSKQENVPCHADSGGASRFFPTFRYQAKPSKRERETGVKEAGLTASHPTVKPVALMRWLIRLVTPPGGLVLDPFTGSGTTGVAAMQEGFRFIGCEREDEYIAIARARIEAAANDRKGEQLSLLDGL